MISAPGIDSADARCAGLEVGLEATKQDVLDKICGDLPILVISKKELVGILNAFDLM